MGAQNLYIYTCLIASEQTKCIYVAGFHEWLQFYDDQNKYEVPVDLNIFVFFLTIDET